MKKEFKKIYRQKDEEGFKQAFERFKRKWRSLYPKVIKSWEKDLPQAMTYLRYPEEIMVYIYITNALERFVRRLRGGAR